MTGWPVSASNTSKQRWPPQSRRIVVLDDTELADDLVRDVTEVLTSMCARLYGRRSAAKRAKAALRAAEVPPR